MHGDRTLRAFCTVLALRSAAAYEPCRDQHNAIGRRCCTGVARFFVGWYGNAQRHRGPAPTISGQPPRIFMKTSAAYDAAVDLLDADHRAGKMFIDHDALCEDGALAPPKRMLAQHICHALDGRGI